MWRAPFRLTALAVGCLLTAVLLCGCAKEGMPRGTVTGKVTLAGIPVSPATIRFENAAAGIALAAEIGPDGAYEVRTYKDIGLPPGSYKVAIAPGSMKAPANIPLAGSEAAPPLGTPAFAAKFHSTETSGLEIDVKEGENPPFDFDLAK